ncbi:transposase, partial [Glutamicibacter arilaitensis]|uniref:transposase n=1 Tax=Glutamicibacter arilaitensis TaxID=256701 RepID=UPI003FCF47E4
MTQPTPELTGNRPLAGRDYPADLAQLLAWFSGDESCVDYLQWLRWPEGICCPRCLSAFVNNEPDNR